MFLEKSNVPTIAATPATTLNVTTSIAMPTRCMSRQSSAASMKQPFSTKPEIIAFQATQLFTGISLNNLTASLTLPHFAYASTNPTSTNLSTPKPDLTTNPCTISPSSMTPDLAQAFSTDEITNRFGFT
uniref:Uncharacterized protein n=1 Tax=Arundo donax TaxID=35708 RepID=A0A0A9C0V8_ARUDO